jgi:hypothetical protein
MSTLTPQEIRDRLAKVESTLQQTWDSLSSKGIVSAINIAALVDAKTNVLHAAALTLLVQQQEIANQLAAAAVYVSLGDLVLARSIVQKVHPVP